MPRPRRAFRTAPLSVLSLALLCLTGALATRHARSAGAQVSPTPTPDVLRQLTLDANDLVVEPNSQTIYASVPSSEGAAGNTVTPIIPETGAVGTGIPVGSEPGRLAVSDDGQFIYVAVNGEATVRRVDVATQTAGLTFSLGNDPTFGGKMRAGDIAVAPGRPHTVAVARFRPGVSPSSGGVVVYDDGVQRPRASGDSIDSNVVEYSGSPEVLYGMSFDASAQFNFRRMGVGPCGVSVLGRWQEFIDQRLFAQNPTFDNGLVYLPSGRVIDPEAMAVVGSFEGVSIFGGLVRPDSKAGRVYFVSPSSTTPSAVSLRVYDINTRQLIGEREFTNINTSFGAGLRALVRWGENGLAFSTGESVYLIQSGLVGGTAQTPAPAPTPPTPTVTLLGRVTDFRDGSGVEGVTVGVTGTRTTSAVTDSAGNYALPGVGICDALTLTPSKPGHVFGPPSAAVNNTPAAGPQNFTAQPPLLRFATGSGFVGENQNRLFVNVSRTGDLSAPASVEYETRDGSASSRSDYTAAFGTLDFAPGETTKTVTLLVTDDVFVEGSESFNVRLKNAVGSPLDPTRTEIAVFVVDNDTTQPTSSPLQNARFFVRRHYQDFLNRDPAADPSGFDFWTQQITECEAEADPQRRAECTAVRRINVSAAFFLSIEFQQTGYLVARLYAASYPAGAARPFGLPRFAEFLRDTQEIGRGVVVGASGWEQRLAQNKEEFLRRWVTRAEFLAEHPEGQGAGAYVESLFANAGAQPSDEERAAAVAAFGAGGAEGRAAALRSVAESRSVDRRQFNRAFVLMQYFGYLRRNPDDAPEPGLNFDGFNFWLSKLEEFNGNFIAAEMVKAFLTSTEYQQRFGPANFDLAQ